MKCLNILGFQIMAAGGNFVTLWLKSLGQKKLGSYGETTELSQPLIPVGLLFIFVGTLTWLRLIYAIVLSTLSQLSLRQISFQLLLEAGGVTVPKLVS